MFLILIISIIEFCNHDEFIQQMRGIQPHVLEPAKALRSTKSRKGPIIINYDLHFLENPILDQYMCKEAGQRISWSNHIYTCAESDILNSTKLENLRTALNESARYFRETLNVTKYSSFILREISNEYPVSKMDSGDADLYLTVYARPFGGSGVLASAYSFTNVHTMDNWEKRPQQGVININIARIPLRSAKLSDKADRGLVETCIHETIHALGFSSSLFESWINRSSSQPYSYRSFPITGFTLKRYPGKVYSILHTPKLHELVKEKYGVEYFVDGCPAGVELEDGGGSGTENSHFEQRTYFTELMTGQTIGYTIISQFTLGLLYDTGWYDVNFSKAEPYTFGDYRAIIGKEEPYKGFAIESPKIAFPPHYISDSKIDGCSYDHSYGGRYRAEYYDCDNKVYEECCYYPNFTDPYNAGMCDPNQRLGDYTSFLVPYDNMFCHRSGAVIKENALEYKYGNKSFCAHLKLNTGVQTVGCYEMECTSSHVLYLNVGNQRFKCAKGQSYFINQLFYIYCPDPNLICGAMKAHEIEPTENTYVSKEASFFSETEKIVMISVSTVAFVIAIVLIATIIKKKFSKRKKREHNEEEESPTESIQSGLLSRTEV